MDVGDADDEDSPRFGNRFGANRDAQPSGPWWRPASKWGRIFLGLGILSVCGVLLAGILSVKSYLSRDSRFRIAGVSNIEATGLTEVTRAQMLPVFGEDIGRNVFFVPLSERRKQLEAIPWVQRATVMRLLPDRIRISVVEREPVAFVRQGQQVGLVDADGVLLSMPAATMAQHHYSFPVVTGIEPRDPLPSRRLRMAVYQRLLAELDGNNQHLSQQISEIDLKDPQDARVLMPEQGADIVAHFGEEKFLERYQRYKAHIAEWRQQYPKLTAVDLRYESQVVLEMTPGTDAVAATLGMDTSSAPSLVAAPAKPPAGTAKAKPSPSQAAMADVAAGNPEVTKPEPVRPELAKPSPARSAPIPSQLVSAATNQKPANPTVTQVAAKQAASTKTKVPRQSPRIEMLAAKQRAARQRAARAAHAKQLRDKKRAADQHAALSPTGKKPSTTRTALPVAEGQ
jgi:cell division protein FtsQ